MAVEACEECGGTGIVVYCETCDVSILDGQCSCDPATKQVAGQPEECAECDGTGEYEEEEDFDDSDSDDDSDPGEEDDSDPGTDPDAEEDK